MNKPASSFAAATLLVATLATTSLISTSAQAYQCSNTRINAKTYAPTKGAALTTSKQYWSSKVKAQFGLAWSVWNIAKRRSTKCYKTTYGHGKVRWSCARAAKPCLLAVP